MVVNLGSRCVWLSHILLFCLPYICALSMANLFVRCFYALLKRYITFSCCVHKTLNHIKNCVSISYKRIYRLEMSVATLSLSQTNRKSHIFLPFAICSPVRQLKKAVSFFLFRSFTSVRARRWSFANEWIKKKWARNRSSALWAIMSILYTIPDTPWSYNMVWIRAFLWIYIKCTQCYEVIFQHNVQRILPSFWSLCVYVSYFLFVFGSLVFEALWVSHTMNEFVFECDFECGECLTYIMVRRCVFFNDFWHEIPFC